MLALVVVWKDTFKIKPVCVSKIILKTPFSNVSRVNRYVLDAQGQWIITANHALVVIGCLAMVHVVANRFSTQLTKLSVLIAIHYA